MSKKVVKQFQFTPNVIQVIYDDGSVGFQGVNDVKSTPYMKMKPSPTPTGPAREYTPQQMMIESGSEPSQQELDQADPFAKYRNPASVGDMQEFLKLFNFKKGK
jgi:hypothetical protein